MTFETKSMRDKHGLIHLVTTMGNFVVCVLHSPYFAIAVTGKPVRDPVTCLRCLGYS